jgi:SAM-dependent methyltransferase
VLTSLSAHSRIGSLSEILNMAVTSYNQKPYLTAARPESHPDRIAALARLMDLPAPLPEQCSLLELGCGTGGNIIPWAERYPGSRFVGIDIANTHVEMAQRVADKLALKNLDLRVGDIATCDINTGAYDYIVCHGVYSWVSEDVQRRILEVCKAALSPNGVVFLSYNVLPGWRQRGLIRDIMMYGASLESSDEPELKLQSAARFLGLVASSRKKKDDLYGRYLQEAIARLQGSDSSYLFHEFLEENNSPCLFSDFIQRAQAVGLQFLSEARPAFMFSDDLGEEETRFLESLGDDVVKREQALDIFRNRMLRETLLCHDDRPLKRDLRASVFRSLVFSTEYRQNGSEGKDVRFRDLTSGGEVSLPKGIGTLVLSAIGEAGPTGTELPDLLRRVAEKGLPSSGEGEVFGNVVALWRAGFVEVSCARYPVIREPIGLAKTSELALLQVGAGDSATSLRHRHHQLSSSERLILSISDGSRDFKTIVDQVEKVARGTAKDALERLVSLGYFMA